MENGKNQGLPKKVQRGGRKDHRLRFAFFFEKTEHAGRHTCFEGI